MPSKHSIPRDSYRPCFNLTHYARTMFTPAMFTRREQLLEIAVRELLLDKWLSLMLLLCIIVCYDRLVHSMVYYVVL